MTAFRPLADRGFTVVLRAGCYVTHDSGIYDELSPMGSRRDGGLRPALEVWGAVLSVPEPGLALVGVGRRDVSYDAGLPTPHAVLRRGGELEPLAGLTVSALNDQHAYVRGDGLDLRVGDAVAFGISHPCTTFDKWRSLVLVDDEYREVGRLTTSFP